MASLFAARVAYGHDKSIVEEYTPSQVAGETFIYGDFVTLSGVNAIRCGADPATILGLSEVVSENARLLTPNGKVPVRTLTSECVLALSSATTPVEATHLNQSYGITRAAGGQWQLDVAKTGLSARVTVVRVDVGQGIFYCKVIAQYLLNDTIVS